MPRLSLRSCLRKHVIIAVGLLALLLDVIVPAGAARVFRVVPVPTWSTNARAGTFRLFSAPASPSYQFGNVVLGYDGNYWYPSTPVTIGSYQFNTVTRFSPTSHAYEQITLPNGNDTSGYGTVDVVPVTDGSVWFGTYTSCKFGRIDTSGNVKYFPFHDSVTPYCSIELAQEDASGNIWFDIQDNASNVKVGYINVATRKTRTFDVPSKPKAPVYQGQIVLGPDGNYWFAAGSAIGRVTPAGNVRLFPSLVPGSSIIVAGPDGCLWYTGFAASYPVVRMNTSGTIVSTLAESSKGIYQLFIGPNGSVWGVGSDFNSGIGGFYDFTNPAKQKVIPFTGNYEDVPNAAASASSRSLFFTTFGRGGGADAKGVGIYSF